MARLKPEDIKVEVIFTEGYEARFTRACLEQLRIREEKQKRENFKPAMAG